MITPSPPPDPPADSSSGQTEESSDDGQPLASPLNPAERVADGRPLALVTLLGGVLLALGSFLPWISYSSSYGEVSRNGLDGGGDGVVTLVIGLVVGVTGATRLMSPSARTVLQWTALILGAFAGWWSAADLAVVNEKVFQSSSEYAIAGPGVYVLLIGALATVIGGGEAVVPAARALIERAKGLRHRVSTVPKRWIAVSLVAVAVAAFLTAAHTRDCSFRGLFAPTPPAGLKDATEVTAGLAEHIPTVRLTVAYTAENDPNELMGCPSAYTSKAMFSDSRITDMPGVIPDHVRRGGTVEVFADESDAVARRAYLQELMKTRLGYDYEYDYLRGPVLLRVSSEFNSDETGEYWSAIAKISPWATN